MATKAKKKRKASPAQLRALAKGRKTAAANRRKSHKKHSTKGAKVARRKTTSSSKKKAVRHTRKSHHSAPRRHHTKRRRIHSMSGGGGSKMKGIMGPVSEAMIAVAGGVLAGIVANKVPIKNEKLKAAAPILAGLGVSFMGIKKRNSLIRNLGTGMMVLGAVALTRKMLPTIPLLAGEDEDTLALPGYVAAQQAAYAGELEYMGDDDEGGLEFMGDPVDLGDDDEISDMLGEDELDEIHLTPANI